MAGGSAIRVAVCDGASPYRRGLGAALVAAGYSVDEVDVGADPAASEVDAVLLTVRTAADWEVIRGLSTASPSPTLVALLVDATPERHAEALMSGAHGVAAWEATPEAIVTVLDHALDGRTLLPTPVAQAMAASGPARYDPDWITEDEVRWLRILASGATVHQLAEEVGYSERALYRMLHGLYGRMRVSNRTEAILQASRWGLLDE